MAKKNTDIPEIDLIQSVKIDISLVDNNDGQIPGVNRNPREVDEIKYRKLKESLKRDAGLTAISELKLYPYQGRWVAIGGNMRLRAMRELGWTEVIAKPIPEDTSKDALNRYILLDNTSFGKWDFDALANEWSSEVLSDCAIDLPEQPTPEDEEEAKDDNCDIDELKPENPRSRLGDIYVLGTHRLICGDSTKQVYLDALMGDDQADIIITDPPYNVDYTGGTKEKKKIANDKMESSQFQDFLAAAFSMADRHLKAGGAFYIWHADSERYNFQTAAHRAGWKPRQTLVWNKNAMVLGRQDYQWKHEPCLYGWKEGAAHYFTPNRSLTTVLEKYAEIDSMTKEELKEFCKLVLSGDIPTTVIDEDKPLRSTEHPTMKPIPLIGRQVMNSSRKGEVVLDMFGGSGTTMMACEQLGRRCRMVEFDPVYVDVIVKRWEQLTGQKAVLAGNIHDTNAEIKQADVTEASGKGKQKTGSSKSKNNENKRK